MTTKKEWSEMTDEQRARRLASNMRWKEKNKERVREAKRKAKIKERLSKLRKSGKGQYFDERVAEVEVMGHVLTTGEDADWTYQQREYREWLKRDRRGFMMRHSEVQKASDKLVTVTNLEGDEGEVRVLELIERILRGASELDVVAK